MFETAATFLDWFGLVVFAVTGALVASRKEMDVTGFVLLAVLTGIGGGTIRDLILGIGPVFWVESPAYILTCVMAAIVTFSFAHIPQSRYRYLLWFDAIGLAIFAVAGAERALDHEAGATVAVVMGVATATFGGVLRDIVGNETPIILSHEIYITAAFAGAALFVCLDFLGLPREVAILAGFVTAFALRAAGLHWSLSLPRYRPRPGRPSDEL